MLALVLTITSVFWQVGRDEGTGVGLPFPFESTLWKWLLTPPPFPFIGQDQYMTKSSSKGSWESGLYSVQEYSVNIAERIISSRFHRGGRVRTKASSPAFLGVLLAWRDDLSSFS
jgi:hypothetical protein